MESDTVIVGAGMAGLAAALSLTEKGRPPVVLEARKRLGGRLFTIDDEFPAPVELGGEFIHGRPNGIMRMVRRAGLSKFRVTDRHWEKKEDGRFCEIPKFWKELSKLITNLNVPKEDCSLLEACRDFPRGQQEFLINFVENFHAAHADRFSAQAAVLALDDDATPSKLHKGYGALIEFMASQTAKGGSEIQYESVVKEVSWSPGMVNILYERKGKQIELQASRLLITVPLGVLKVPINEPGHIKFTPRLTEKIDALDRMEMGHVTKLILRFSEPFWEDSEPKLGLLHTTNKFFPVIWTSFPVKVPLLTLWSGGPNSDECSKLNEHELLSKGIETLAHLFARTTTEIESYFRQAYFHDWNRDPFSLGAYSYELPGGASAPEDLSKPLYDTLFFAGEATQPKAGATVHAAFDTGVRAAREILTSTRNRFRRAS